MKMIQKVALALLSVGVLIGLGTHIDSIYQNRRKQMLNTNIDATQDTARNIVKKAKGKRRKRVETTKAKISNEVENGGISMHMFDKHNNQSYLLFKKVEKHYGVGGETDVVSVAIPTTDDSQLKLAKLWAKSGKFKLYTQEVTGFEKPIQETRDYVWVSEAEIERAIGIAKQNNPHKSLKGSKIVIRDKHGQKVELESHLLAALSNHYGKVESKSKKETQKVSQMTDKKKVAPKKSKTKLA